jgi:uncharacterized protein
LSEYVLYHDGARALQDRFDSRRLADRLEERLARSELTGDDVAFIARQAMFMFATADADGWPDCSYKGGETGFVRVLDARTLVFPSYDGNGMFKSLGNVRVNPRVGMLFVDFERPSRLRVQGLAELVLDDAALLAGFPGAQCAVRVRIERVFPNCPRYIHTMKRLAISEYAPRTGYTPPEPAWKKYETFCDVLPRR